MDFINVFDELDKLYEEESATKTEKVVINESLTNESALGAIGLAALGVGANAFAQTVGTNLGNKLTEDGSEEEPVVAEEVRQVIIECDKCGACIIKDETDIEVDEKSDLVNVDDECKFCEEKAGFKIVGVVAPYEAVEEPVEEPAEEIQEDLADVARKVLDKPASIATQQVWEDRLDYLQSELEDPNLPEKKRARIKKEIAKLEAKFQQQRDWEAKHPEKDPQVPVMTPHND